jgi:acyl-CoA synthetase (AMP-forming)/AMP-acid ligase II
MGISTYVMPRFELEKFCQTIEKYKVTYAYAVPPVILQLLENPKARKYNLSSIRMLKCSAAPLSPQLIASLKEQFSINVRQAYGMSECSPCTHMQV